MSQKYTRVYALGQAEWVAVCAEIDRLAARLPDGRSRVVAFQAAAQAASDRDGYLTERVEVHGGMAVTIAVPGPLTLAFVAELEGGL
ncbi:hypothetical protein [Falsirhodobacter halotolerans]|uniref:hypothetical protein n=1 Tax=Falsirhodobacter halotolerans TaxID=1146892 RepID=UPI001FD2E0E7|nr:hypothetical protein [Falsirhodobacter halotolerans]MCJ8139497.1 hypothetical protein [Falsirhodobacter halotolerans]